MSETKVEVGQGLGSCEDRTLALRCHQETREDLPTKQGANRCVGLPWLARICLASNSKLWPPLIKEIAPNIWLDTFILARQPKAISLPENRSIPPELR